MPRHDPLLAAGPQTAFVNNAIILDEIGADPRSDQGTTLEMVGRSMAARLHQLCMEVAARHR
jgi:hypothetical protein